MKFLFPEEYQQKSRDRFSELARDLSVVLPNAKIEHVGSSAIEGAISKGDLDVFVGVDPSVHEESVVALQGVGYVVKEATHRDSELCMLEQPCTNIALQVVANGSKYEFFITFRDVMSGSPELVGQYNELKLSCRGSSVDTYRSAKSQFISRILAQV